MAEYGIPDFNFSYPDFNSNFDFGQFQFPEFDFSQFQYPDFNYNWDFGGVGGFNPGQFNFPDPLALPSFDSNFSSQFNPSQGMDFGGLFQPSGNVNAGDTAMSLADLGFGGSNAPQTALPNAGLAQGSDQITNLMGSDQGQGGGYGGPQQGDPFNPFGDLGLGGGSPLPGGSDYGTPGGGPVLGLGGAPYAPGAQPATPGGPMAQQQGLGLGYNAQGQPMSEFEKFLAAQTAKTNQPASSWDTIAKLAAAFGPTALGAAGLGLQSANRPSRNPLEDDLLRARIQSTGMQDTLAKDRLSFEKDNAQAQREAQMEMQNALLESHKPGGQGNIDALLKGNPQLAALYQALTKQTTGLAGGGDAAFNALIEQVAQVDIAELQRQAQQQIAQAQEMAARQGINPANIIAEVQQRLLQESAKARANARQTLISQLQPGISTFNSIGGLFGNLFQTPSAG